MRQIRFFRTITAIFLILLLVLPFSSCQTKKNFEFITEPYSADIMWEYGGHKFCAALYVGESTDTGRTLNMKMTSPASLAGIELIHNSTETKLTYGEITLGKEMCARYFAIVSCAVPSGGLKYLSRADDGREIFADAKGKWWYFEKDAQLPSAVEYKDIKIEFQSFLCANE